MNQRPSFTCPECSTTSHHPRDVQYGYCGQCHRYTGPEARAQAAQAGLAAARQVAATVDVAALRHKLLGEERPSQESGATS